MTTIKGFKAFNKDLKCRDFQFELNKEFIHNGEIITCKSGFHFCENPLDIFSYYSPAESRFAMVECSGKTVNHSDDSKIACSNLKIENEISLTQLIDEGIKYILDRVTLDESKKSSNSFCQSLATNTGDMSVATNRGDISVAINRGFKSAALNTGYYSTALNTGKKSAALNTGYKSVALNTGDNSAGTNTGDYSIALNTGDNSVALNTGNFSVALNTGDNSVALTTGYFSAATYIGYQSAATCMGHQSAAIVKGNNSIAIVTNYCSKAKGKIGCWLVLTEREIDGNILSVSAKKVDGVDIKEDTYYQLIDNNFIEVE